MFAKLSLAQDDIAQIADLDGVDWPQEATHDGVWSTSFMGGSQIYITGAGLDMEPSLNDVMYTTSDLTGEDITFAAPPMSEDEEFLSGVSMGKLSRILPPLEVLTGIPKEQLQSFTTLIFEISVITSDPAEEHVCKERWRCRVQYNIQYTPVVYYTIPQVLYYDMDLDFAVNPKASSNHVGGDDLPVEQLKIGDSLITTENYVDPETTLSNWYQGYISGLLGDNYVTKNVQPKAKFKSGDSFVQPVVSVTCSFDEQDCYTNRILSRIDSVSANEGYVTGGQTLEITGKGFGIDLSAVSIDIDGVACDLKTITDTKLTCMTNPRDAGISTVDVSQPGQHGLKNQLYNRTEIHADTNTWIDLNNFADYDPDTDLDYVMTSIDSLTNRGTQYIQSMKGLFKAPITAEYRFFISCDDTCRFYLDTSENRDSSTLVAYRNWWTNYRNYLFDYAQGRTNDEDSVVNTYISEWITLTEGEYYPIETTHYQGTGGSHATVSMEIKYDESTAGMHHAGREIQMFEIGQTVVKEQTKVRVNNNAAGSYKLVLIGSAGDTWVTDSISANQSADVFRNRVNWFYRKEVGSSVDVTRVMYDAEGLLTEDSDLAVDYEYTIEVQKLFNGQSFVSIRAAADDTGNAPTFVIQTPDQVQLSQAPMSGKFTISCEINSQLYTTDPMVYNEATVWIQERLFEAIPQYRDRLIVQDTYKYDSYQNGRRFILNFNGANEDIPQCSVESDVDNPIIGDEPFFTATTERDYGTNLFYEPVPIEFLYTDEQKPQVLVTVQDLPSICTGFNCGYAYTQPVSEITSVTLNTDTSQITIEGTDLPTTDISIHLSSVECPLNVDTDTITDVLITCTFADPLVAGSWFVELRDLNGLIPLADGLVETVVALTISDSSPSTAINALGGTTLTITGTGFHPYDTSALTAQFTDGTDCLVTSISSNTAECYTNRFAAESIGTDQGVTLTQYGQSADITYTIDTLLSSENTTLVPSSVSPVLKQILTITVDSAYDSTLTLDIEELTVMIVPQDPEANPKGVEKELFITGVNDFDRTVDAKYGGAWSGVYDIVLTHDVIGRINMDGVYLTVGSTITDFNPKQGSKLGGTLMTITGTNFSNDNIQDNPVKVGDNYCYLISTSATEIVCRIDSFSELTVGENEVVVFLMTSEEAVCATETGTCMFTVNEPAATVTNISTEYQTDSQAFHVIVAGTNFQSSSDYELYIDDILQTTDSGNDEQIIFEVVEMLDVTSSNVQLYFTEGIVQLDDSLAGVLTVTLTPVFESLSPQIGGFGGTILTINMPGVGVNTLDSKDISLKRDGGANVCEIVEVPSFGVITCRTTADTYTMTSDIATSIAIGSEDVYECANNDVSLCRFTQNQDTDASILTVAFQDGSTDTIQVTGTNFPTDRTYTVYAVYNGVEAQGTVLSAESLEIAFTEGVPLASNEVDIVIEFRLGTDPETGFAAQNTQALANPILIGSFTPTIECSFAGGCEITVQANNLNLSMLENSESTYIDICGNKCVLDEEQSTTDNVVCSVPPLMTTYSAAQYSLGEEKALKGTIISSNADETEQAKLFDGDNVVFYNDDTASGCYTGIQLKELHVGVLTEAKFYIGSIGSYEPYANKVTFQGSDDGSTYTDIHQFDDDVHEGWNVYSDFTESSTYYRYYRFYGEEAGSCYITEIKFIGNEVVDDTNDSKVCTASVVVQDAAVQDISEVTYTSTKTYLLESISPRYGNVVGGQDIVFASDDILGTETARIWLDEIECATVTVEQGSFTCTSSPRLGLGADEPTFKVLIEDQGEMAQNDLVFMYVSYWSEPSTWGGDFAPIEGDSVSIPKGLHLLVDVDQTPILNAVIVEGSLIFLPEESEPNHQREFRAHMIMIQGGYMEVGTEDHPYTSKMTITLFSTVEDPALPTYGNKVIGVRYGTLLMFGNVRTPVWTSLSQTVQPGDKVINLMEPVDWQAGEHIVIASTNFDPHEAEEMIIESIDETMQIITLTEPLEYRHISENPSFGEDSIEMRAEVGLLTRNVLFQGNPEDSAINQYGAHIMLHSVGDDSLIGRIEYVEFFNCGQAFKLGRYPIHFHMIGNIHKSRVLGNAVHQTYNRAFTIHGVHYYQILNNVAYDNMGHAFFIEDAIETNCLIDGNLAVLTKRSWSLLNTDQTPASFWLTNPNNIIRNNHAAGSDRYGYWYDTQEHTLGPSFTTSICPEYVKLGEFRDNVTHSNGRYGLRIFHKLIPLTYPCMGVIFDAENPDDPYHQNPLITANFYNLISYKNGRNGAIAETVGDVRWHNFKTADNLLAGMEFSKTTETWDGTAQIASGLVVGNSGVNSEDALESSSPHGIITPGYDNFQVHNVKFYNYNWNNAAGLGSCSHCFHPAATDSGSRTTTFSGLYFDDDTVPRRIRYQFPFRPIFYDIDGTLTNEGDNSWATGYFPNLRQPECKYDEDTLTKWNGVVCDGTVTVRRVVFYGYQPNDRFQGLEMRVLQYDDSYLSSMTADEQTAYEEDKSNYGHYWWKEAKDPNASWPLSLVTGKKYKIHWQEGLDFERMKYKVSEKWTVDDPDIVFVHNFTDVRENVTFAINGNQDNLLANETYVEDSSNNQNGYNLVLNDTETREITFVANGKNPDNLLIQIDGYRCQDSCVEAISDSEVEDTIRLWSDPSSWTSGAVPVEGDFAEVEPGWNMVYDLEDSPILEFLTINGRLTFSDEFDQILRVKHIFIRSGELIIGNEEVPYQNNAEIILYGMADEASMVYDGAIEAGNKAIVNVGLVKMYGLPRTDLSYQTRLHSELDSGDTTFKVSSGLDWVPGDYIVVMTNTYNEEHTEYFTVVEYDASGLVTVSAAAQHYHYGATTISQDYDGLDIRAEVGLLSRNVKISGEDVDGWGGQFLTGDFLDLTNDGPVQRSGSTYLDNVQVYNCSQRDTDKAALRWKAAFTGSSRITNSAIHHGVSWGVYIHSSKNIEFDNNVIVGFSPIGFNIVSVTEGIVVTNNLIGDLKARPSFGTGEHIADIEGCLMLCSYENPQSCSGMTITNNIVAGCKYVGYTAPAHDCDDPSGTDHTISGNVAHSVNWNGVIVFPDPGRSQSSCYHGSGHTAYKAGEASVIGYSAVATFILDNIVSIDSALGVIQMIGKEGDDLLHELRNSKIYGESEIQDDKCMTSQGYMIPFATQNSKPVHITSTSALPMYKTKSNSSFGGRAEINNVEFIGFTSGETRCGAKQRIFFLNKSGSDFNNFVTCNSCQFTDIATEAMAYIYDPPDAWASIEDCGEWPCTGPENVVLKFKSASYSGQSPTYSKSNFQIISDYKDTAGSIQNCEKVQSWNAWHCQNDQIGHLLFESLDGDTMDRSVQPIYLESEETGYYNKLNSFMDHIWDGFYTGQLRMTRFQSMVEAQGGYFSMTFTGTPPGNLRYKLFADAGSMKIGIAYPNAGSYSLKLDDKIQDYTPWDKEISQYAELPGRKCGENRYVSIKNIFEFYLTAGCEIAVTPRDAIQSFVRMEWTMDEFYSQGGVVSFTNRVAAALGIHASTIKTVSVYEGSLVVEFIILADDDECELSDEDREDMDQDEIDDWEEECRTDQLAGTTEKLAVAMTDEDAWLGAPILDAQIDGQTEKWTSDFSPDEFEYTDYKSAYLNQWIVDQNTSNKDSNTEDNEPKIESVDDDDNTLEKETEYRYKTREKEEEDTSNLELLLIILIAVVLLSTIAVIAMTCYFKYTKAKNFRVKNTATAPTAREVTDDQMENKVPAKVRQQSQYVPNIDDIAATKEHHRQKMRQSASSFKPSGATSQKSKDQANIESQNDDSPKNQDSGRKLKDEEKVQAQLDE